MDSSSSVKCIQPKGSLTWLWVLVGIFYACLFFILVGLIVGIVQLENRNSSNYEIFCLVLLLVVLIISLVFVFKYKAHFCKMPKSTSSKPKPSKKESDEE